MSEPTPVDAKDPAKKNSEILDATADEATVSMDLQDVTCVWNDAEFRQGDRVSADGQVYECSYGRWIPLDE